MHELETFMRGAVIAAFLHPFEIGGLKSAARVWMMTWPAASVTVLPLPGNSAGLHAVPSD